LRLKLGNNSLKITDRSVFNGLNDFTANYMDESPKATSALKPAKKRLLCQRIGGIACHHLPL